jgi:hypothetical protein
MPKFYSVNMSVQITQLHNRVNTMLNNIVSCTKSHSTQLLCYKHTMYFIQILYKGK